MGKREGRLRPSRMRYLAHRYASDRWLEEVAPHPLRYTFGQNLMDAACHCAGKWPLAPTLEPDLEQPMQRPPQVRLILVTKRP